MLISVDKRLVFLSMPKCGSTAIVQSLGKHFGASFRWPPAMKHMPYPVYHRKLRPLLAHYTDKPFETVCLFREPLDWRRSWWRYRMRPEAQKRGNRTEGLSFPDFVEGNLSGSVRPSKTGSPAHFVSERSGRIGVDRIYRYENIDACYAYLCERLGARAPLKKANVTTARPKEDPLSDALLARAREAWAREYEIYETIAL